MTGHKEIRVLAKTKYEAIAKIRERAAMAQRGGRYFLVRRYFWRVVWALLCICVALVAGRPLAALVLLALPFGLGLLGRLMKTAYGLLLLACVFAYALYQVGSMVPKINRFLEGTTFKFVSGDGALIIPHSSDMIRLYAQDDFFIGARLKDVGDTIYPNERLLIADFAKEVVELVELQESVRPREAYVDYLLSQHLREREQTQTDLKVRELEHQQVGLERQRFERQATEGVSTLETYRALLGRGLISQKEFWEMEREYERLRTTYEQLGLEKKQLSSGLDTTGEKNVLAQEYRFEKAQIDFLRFRTDSQRSWLGHLAYIAAPGSGRDRPLSRREMDPSQAGSALRAPHVASLDQNRLSGTASSGPEADMDGFASSAGTPAQAQTGRCWSCGKLVHLAGSRSSSQVRRGDLVAEIWVGEQRKRIGLELPRAKMVGVEIGSPVNFMLDEEVGDFGAVVHGRIEKIQSTRGSDNFWIEAGGLAVVGEESSLGDFPIGLAGNYRIGLHPISHKEKYLKIRAEARSLGEMWSALRQYATAYVRREAGEDFVADPPAGKN